LTAQGKVITCLIYRLNASYLAVEFPGELTRFLILEAMWFFFMCLLSLRADVMPFLFIPIWT